MNAQYQKNEALDTRKTIITEKFMQDNNIEGLGEKRALLVMTFLEIKSCSKMSEPTSTFQYWQLPVLVLPGKEWKVIDHPRKLCLPFYNLQASLITFLCKNNILFLFLYFKCYFCTSDAITSHTPDSSPVVSKLSLLINYLLGKHLGYALGLSFPSSPLLKSPF